MTDTKGFISQSYHTLLLFVVTFFTVRVVKHWHRFPREVVEASALEIFKSRLDRTLSNLVQLKMSLLTAGGLG